MTREEKALTYFKDLRARKVKDYSSVFDTAPKDSVVYEAVSAEIEIYDTTIKALEQTRWIPCSERLPKENEYIGDVCKYYLIQDEYGDMHVAHLSNVGWIPMGSLKAIGDEIIAWQELPESYKAESEE